MEKIEARNKIIEYCREIDWYSMHISDIEAGIDDILDQHAAEVSREAYPDYTKGEAEFCGKCGTVI